MILYKNQDSQILKNFTEKELFCKSPDCPESHNFDNRLLIIQDIRDYYTKKGYDIKIHISSSFRTSLGNLLCGGAKNSMHLIGKALDFQIVGKDAAKVKSDYINQIKEKKYLFEKLRKGGISGMGIYPTFFHIDCRDESDNTAFNSSDKYGKYSFWNNFENSSDMEITRSGRPLLFVLLIIIILRIVL
jgi:uncharacterized protein YcbK (DUF882 family)